jgi:hypothetical protein
MMTMTMTMTIMVMMMMMMMMMMIHSPSSNLLWVASIVIDPFQAVTEG